MFKTLAPALREHRELRFLLTPTNYIQAINGYLKLSAGIGVGWLQQLRGAHFLSHTLWSAWVAC